jgi:hypothetical protein
MTVVFDQQNAAITTDVLGSEAILSITPVFAILNLKRNNGLILNGTDNKQPPAALSAIKIVGTVYPSLNDGDNLNNWDIHFIQLINESAASYYYAGRQKSDGCMVFDLATSRHGSGTLTGTGYMLDSAQNVAPFTNGDPPTIQSMINPVSGGIVARIDTTMADHPYSKMPLWVQNFASKRWNIIIRARVEVDFYTALVVREKSASNATFTVLGYVQWWALWDFSLTHSRSHTNFSNLNSIPHPIISAARHNFEAGLFVPEPPQDTSLARQIFIASAQDPMYNAESNRIQKEALGATQNLPTVTAYRQWDARADHPGHHFTH